MGGLLVGSCPNVSEGLFVYSERIQRRDDDDDEEEEDEEEEDQELGREEKK